MSSRLVLVAALVAALAVPRAAAASPDPASVSRAVPPLRGLVRVGGERPGEAGDGGSATAGQGAGAGETPAEPPKAPPAEPRREHEDPDRRGILRSGRGAVILIVLGAIAVGAAARSRLSEKQESDVR